jgi:hypothetical protein
MSNDTSHPNSITDKREQSFKLFDPHSDTDVVFRGICEIRGFMLVFVRTAKTRRQDRQGEGEAERGSD